jgi:hypothetical protein
MHAAASKLVLVLVVALLAPSASAEIFRCAEKNGLDRYQNFPCAFDSLGTPVVGAAPAKVMLAGQARPVVAPAPEARNRTPKLPSEPRAGMTEDEVRAIWGPPDEVIQDEPSDGRIEIWRYGDARSVQFSNKHRVLVVLP